MGAGGGAGGGAGDRRRFAGLGRKWPSELGFESRLVGKRAGMMENSSRGSVVEGKAGPGHAAARSGTTSTASSSERNRGREEGKRGWRHCSPRRGAPGLCSR